MSSLGDLGTKFPLHILVWKNDFRQLEEALEKKVKAGGGGSSFFSILAIWGVGVKVSVLMA